MQIGRFKGTCLDRICDDNLPRLNGSVTLRVKLMAEFLIYIRLLSVTHARLFTPALRSQFSRENSVQILFSIARIPDLFFTPEAVHFTRLLVFGFKCEFKSCCGLQKKSISAKRNPYRSKGSVQWVATGFSLPRSREDSRGRYIHTIYFLPPIRHPGCGVFRICLRRTLKQHTKHQQLTEKTTFMQHLSCINEV